MALIASQVSRSALGQKRTQLGVCPRSWMHLVSVLEPARREAYHGLAVVEVAQVNVVAGDAAQRAKRESPAAAP
jgi:hypothetical protein